MLPFHNVVVDEGRDDGDGDCGPRSINDLAHPLVLQTEQNTECRCGMKTTKWDISNQLCAAPKAKESVVFPTFQ